VYVCVCVALDATASEMFFKDQLANIYIYIYIDRFTEDHILVATFMNK